MLQLQTLGLWFVLLSLWLPTSLSAGAAPPPPNPGPIIPSRQRDRGLLDRAIRDGRAVTPERAIESVRQFCKVPNLEVSVELYRDRPLQFRSTTSYFTLAVSGGRWDGSFTVRAEDGSVQGWLGHGDIDYSEQKVPLISIHEAEQRAKQFARERIPGFDQRVWHTPREYPVIQDATYDVIWTEVLNRSGALACWSLELTVDRASGRVISYAAPQGQFNGPLIPRISRSRAIQLASRVADYDPSRVPFGEINLEVWENSYGIQGLSWSLLQFPDPGNPDRRSAVCVNPLTGEATNMSHPTETPGPRLRPEGGEPLHSGPLPRRDGTLWARVELLRGLGALVRVQPDQLIVRAGEVLTDEKTLGAKRRKDGWWVPIREACKALGWTTRWDGTAQQVVVDTGSPPPR